MTRINLVPVSTLSRLHLIAEYRELPRVFKLAHDAHLSHKNPWMAKQPKDYTLGTGHVLFFYDKLLFLSTRHKQLVEEMLSRGYVPQFTGCLQTLWCNRIPAHYWKDYIPTEAAIVVNKQRIAERS